MLTLEREVTDDEKVTVCKKGVNIPFLVKIAHRVEQEWTTSDVCTKLVLPETQGKKLAYYQLEPDATDEMGNKMIGEADYFCSHAWKYKFVNVVDALGQFCKKKNLIPEQTYFWFDLFINNQHQAPNLSYKWWCIQFKQAIRSFGKVVLILEPWSDPIPFKRAWCLWEIFCTIVTHSEFNVAMCEDQHNDFNLRLVKDFEQIRLSLSKIDARRADASNKEDRDKIFAAIRDADGFLKLNERVIGKMREWLLNAGEAHSKETSVACGDDNLTTLMTYNCLGKVYRDMNQYSEAEQHFSKALSGLIRTTGKDSTYTTEVMNNYAYTLQQQGKYEEAIEMHEDCLKYRRKRLGKFHKDTTQSMSNLATALRKFDLERAKKLFKEAVECRDKIKNMGPDHPATLYTVSQYALTLSINKDFKAAEEQHQRAIKGLDQFFSKKIPDGRKHPLTLIAIHNMGHHFMLLRRNFDAWELLSEAYNGRVEKLGSSAKDTQETKNLLDQTVSSLQDEGIDTLQCYLKEKKLRRQLWKKASNYLHFREGLRLRLTERYSEKWDFSGQ